MVLNGLKTCDTCRKALKAVLAAGLEGRLRDFRAEPPSRDEVAKWHANLGDALLNTRSTTWRGLSEADRAADPIDLMLAHPALIKRPVVETEGVLMLGWAPPTQRALGL
ncbi:arsenate reductase family protein [Jannaschia sp. M317]|uniref:arsenate reductase family protein n=1 Tax=Jannaschia sp. M317 TaxID=2867011 RepID=UPI0021A4156D|nr:arsenate reductase [Jannaschia sp. M317]